MEKDCGLCDHKGCSEGSSAHTPVEIFENQEERLVEEADRLPCFAACKETATRQKLSWLLQRLVGPKVAGEPLIHDPAVEPRCFRFVVVPDRRATGPQRMSRKATH